MGHSQLGGETVLYLIDGLFGGYYADARPFPWGMWPFHWDWPSSLLASQDPVAIDSVGYDFVNAEWPDVVRYGHAPHPQYDLIGGAEDYLHEAALANDPCSGTFYDPDHAEGVQRLESLGVHEHWNDPVNKQYSRNLGAQSGIELVLLSSRAVPGDLNSDGKVDDRDLRIVAENWLRPRDPNSPGTDLKDFAILARSWRAITTQEGIRQSETRPAW